MPAVAAAWTWGVTARTTLGSLDGARAEPVGYSLSVLVGTTLRAALRPRSARGVFSFRAATLPASRDSAQACDRESAGSSNGVGSHCERFNRWFVKGNHDNRHSKSCWRRGSPGVAGGRTALSPRQASSVAPLPADAQASLRSVTGLRCVRSAGCEGHKDVPLGHLSSSLTGSGAGPKPQWTTSAGCTLQV